MEVPPSVEITDGQRLETEQLQDESSMDGVQQSGGQETGEQQTGEQQIGEQKTGEQQIGEQQTGEPQTGEQEMWGIRDGGRVLVSGTTTAPLRRSTRITRGVPPVRYAWAVVVELVGLDDEEEDEEWTNLDPDSSAVVNGWMGLRAVGNSVGRLGWSRSGLVRWNAAECGSGACGRGSVRSDAVGSDGGQFSAVGSGEERSRVVECGSKRFRGGGGVAWVECGSVQFQGS
ncbi:unnamed protein product [Closterium sp. NIES-65]|nr:unnamed protein product [Closterium sp. NIES-65]